MASEGRQTPGQIRQKHPGFETAVFDQRGLQQDAGLGAAVDLFEMAARAVDQGEQILFLEVVRLNRQGLDLVFGQVHQTGQVGVDLQQHQVAEVGDHAPGEGVEALAPAGQVVHQSQGSRRVPGDDRLVQLQEKFRADQPEGGHHGAFVDDLLRTGDHLVQQTQAVPHAAFGQGHEQAKAGLLEGHTFGGGDLGQPRGQFVPVQQPEIETLAATQDGARNLVGFGGGEEEKDPRGRFLENLQQGVEGPLGEHVDLVDDEDPAAAFARRVLGHVPQLADVVDPGVAGRVDFQDVQVVAACDGLAGFTGSAGIALLVGAAIDGLGQQAGHGGLAATAGSGKKIGVTEFPLAQGGPQRARHVGLAHDLVEGLGAVLAGEGLVGHGAPLEVLGCGLRPQNTSCPGNLP